MPPVIEPETFGTEDEQAPTVVWTPTAAPMRDGEHPPLVLREMQDGRVAMLAYTSLEEMTEGCGPGQPFISIDAEAVQVCQHLAEADVVLWNPVLAAEVRQCGEYDEDGRLREYDEGRDRDGQPDGCR